MPSYRTTETLNQRFHTEPGSQAVDAIFAVPENQVFTSRPALVQLTSVAALKVRTGALKPRQAKKSPPWRASRSSCRQKIDVFQRRKKYPRRALALAGEPSGFALGRELRDPGADSPQAISAALAEEPHPHECAVNESYPSTTPSEYPQRPALLCESLSLVHRTLRFLD